MRNWKSCITGLAVILTLIMTQPCFAANSGGGLTWNGKSATLKQIAEETEYDLVDTNGYYKPMYTFAAEALWNDGLFFGSDGSFDLDMPLTREQGIVMILRILGKDKEAVAQNLTCKFKDVAAWASPYVAYAEKNGLAMGISDTEFGGSEVMTAAQYCTLALRALGYEDGSDFVWNKAVDKALEIGLIGEPCHLQYTRSNLFLRDNAAMISYNALYKDCTKTGSKLILTIDTQKPAGMMPAAARGGAAKQDITKSSEKSGAKVVFSDINDIVVRKVNGSVDYVVINVRLNFTVPPSSTPYTANSVTFRIEQNITPINNALNQSKVSIHNVSSATTIGDGTYNGFTIVFGNLYRYGGGGDGKHITNVYIDETNELIGTYELILEDGGVFYFK